VIFVFFCEELQLEL